MKSYVLHTAWCDISGETAGEIWNWCHYLSERVNCAGRYSHQPQGFSVRLKLIWKRWKVIVTKCSENDQNNTVSAAAATHEGPACISRSYSSRMENWRMRNLNETYQVPVWPLESLVQRPRSIPSAISGSHGFCLPCLPQWASEHFRAAVAWVTGVASEWPRQPWRNSAKRTHRRRRTPAEYRT